MVLECCHIAGHGTNSIRADQLLLHSAPTVSVPEQVWLRDYIYYLKALQVQAELKGNPDSECHSVLTVVPSVFDLSTSLKFCYIVTSIVLFCVSTFRSFSISYELSHSCWEHFSYHSLVILDILILWTCISEILHYLYSINFTSERKSSRLESEIEISVQVTDGDCKT